MSPCEDGSGKPATGMKLTPRWPIQHSPVLRKDGPGRGRAAVLFRTCAAFRRPVSKAALRPFRARHTAVLHALRSCASTPSNGIPYGVAGDARVPPDRAKDHHDQRRRRPARPRSARSPIRIRPRPSGCGMGCGWRVSRGVDSREWECPVARASRFTTPTSAHVKRRPLKA